MIQSILATAWGGMNSAMRRHLELQIKTLQNAPRDPDKLERLLKSKRRQKEEEAMHIEDTERLVTEIEKLKVVLFLVRRNRRKQGAPTIFDEFFIKKC